MAKRKGKKKRKYTKRKKTGNRKRSRKKGLIGRTGALIVGLTPLIVSGADAGFNATAIHKKYPDANIIDTIGLSFKRFVNDMSYGFGLGDTFKNEKGNLTIHAKDGSSIADVPAHGDVPKGCFWISTITGTAMVAIDRAIGFISESGTNLPGTSIPVIGSK